MYTKRARKVGEYDSRGHVQKVGPNLTPATVRQQHEASQPYGYPPALHRRRPAGGGRNGSGGHEDLRIQRETSRRCYPVRSSRLRTPGERDRPRAHSNLHLMPSPSHHARQGGFGDIVALLPMMRRSTRSSRLTTTAVLSTPPLAAHTQ